MRIQLRAESTGQLLLMFVEVPSSGLFAYSDPWADISLPLLEPRAAYATAAALQTISGICLPQLFSDLMPGHSQAQSAPHLTRRQPCESEQKELWRR